MSRFWRTWRYAGYLLLIVAALVLVGIYWRLLVAIWREQALTFIGAIVIMVCGTLVQARNFLVFLDTRPSVRLWRFARVWALSALANYVAPLQPGIAVRVAWLLRRGISIPESLLATWRQLVASVWMSLIGLAIGLLMTGDPRGRWPALSLALLWLAAIFLRKFSLRWLQRLQWPAWLVRRKELLHRAATGITFDGLFGVVIQYICGTLLLYWVYIRFGASIGVGKALIIACLIYVSSVIALLPANLGVSEAIYMLSGYGLGLDAATAGALAILIRVAHIAANLAIVLAGDIARSRAGGDGT